MIIGNLASDLRFHGWRPMAIDGPKRPFCGHGVGTAGTHTRQGYPGPRIPAGAGWVAPAVGCPRCLAPVSGTPRLSLACRAELQEVGPALLRTVSGRASRRLPAPTRPRPR